MTEESRAYLNSWPDESLSAWRRAVVAELVNISRLLERAPEIDGASVLKESVSRKAVKKAVRGRR